MTAPKDPVFDWNKPYSSVQSLEPQPWVHEQFGGRFDGSGNFVEWTPGYSPKTHGEKRAPRKRKPRSDVRKLTPAPTPVAAEVSAAAAEAATAAVGAELAEA